MMTKVAVLLFLLHFRRVYSTPLRQAKQLPPGHEVPVLIQHHTPLVPHVILTQREKKSPNYISIPLNQYLVPKLHVIPAQSNIHHSSFHTDVKHIVTNDNHRIPIITQTVSHSTTNITHPHPQSVIPIFVPVHQVHHNFVPVHDLSVIPLQKNYHKIEQKIEHYKVAEKKDEEEEVNRFRTFYGGFGTGLFFGGHGAGHGFHIFG